MRVVIKGIEHQISLAGLQKIGRGGEGDVYLLVLSGKKYALKLYFRPDEEKHLKIKAMIDNCPKDAISNINGIEFIQLAWPLGVAFEGDRFLGFVMPYVETSLSNTLDFYLDKSLYNEKFKQSPLTLTYRIEIARNLAGVVKLLHDSGHFFIDFKPQNVRIYDRYHLVSLIDCDGFSIAGLKGERFPAKSYSSEYIYPDALIKNKPPESLALKQDLFALSVVIFQLLNHGIHPFSGLIGNSDSATTTDEKVSKGYYPYGKVLHSKIRPIKNSVHETLSDPIRDLFDRSFIDPVTSPPTVQSWIDALEDILRNKRLVKCSFKPNSAEHIHFEGKECQACLREKFSKRVNISSKLPSSSKPYSSSSQKRAATGVKSIPQYKAQPFKGGNSGLLITLGVVGVFILLVYGIANLDPSKPIAKKSPTPVKIEANNNEDPIYAVAGSWQNLPNDASCLKQKVEIYTSVDGLGSFNFVKIGNSEDSFSAPILGIKQISSGIYRLRIGNENFEIETDYKKLSKDKLKIMRLVYTKPEKVMKIIDGKYFDSEENTPIFNRCP